MQHLINNSNTLAVVVLERSPNGNWAANKEIKAPYALASLFSYTSIVAHPTCQLQLPATRLTKGCYTHMFDNSKIELAPVLPATTMARSCYEGMFSCCNVLTQAPALPAKLLPKRCYSFMFSGCKKLNNVKCMGTAMTGNFALGSWLETAGTDESVTIRTLTHAAGTPWTVSDEYARGTTDRFVSTGWTLVSM